MKASKFNVFFKHSESEIGFNSYTQEYIILDTVLFELYQNGLRKSDFSELEEIHNDFYNFLIQQGFLVENNLDEFELIKELSQKIDNDDSHFSLTINPTMNCNFKCWYCYETHIKDSKMSSDTITATINLAHNIIENQKNLKSFSLSFFGGEPLLYFHKVIEPILIDISSLCKEKGISFDCGMTTNGLLINQDILDVCKIYGLSGFQITLDGNKEQHDKVRFISEERGSYDKIVNNIILIAKNKLTASVRINCSVETIEGLNEIKESFEVLSEYDQQFIHFDFHKVWQVTDNIEPDIDKSRFFFKEKGFDVRIGAYDTVVNSCYADKRNQATINYNGEIFKCTARDFQSYNSEGILNNNGSITWNEKYEKRLNSKFKNPPCKECMILPICGGGCSQQAIEHEGIDYCVYNFDEEAKTQLVINKFKALVT